MDLKEYILSEAGLADIFFGKIPFGGDGQLNPRLRKLAGFKDSDKEPNTKNENTLYDTLESWVDNARPEYANQLLKFKPAIEAAAKKYPKIFLPETPPKTLLYRGLRSLSGDIQKQLKQITNWERITIRNQDYHVCKKPIKYNPRRAVQSWSSDPDVAEDFANSGMLVTRQNKEFLFSQKVMKLFYGGDEEEILHFGRDYSSKVYITLADWIYEDLFKIKKINVGWKDVANKLV